ncbi:MAG: nucleotide exchange factor GrpE [Thiotrichaceae bacterium]|nr:nucleotide exchange factor GrpE [Thiotrichaceae bacterium]PCI11157.1 MAG: nucleotide exchange factor GrpE [Thiotrichales bacterium]PCI12869.1 MAG: nucleotide exchange factor GrpE [Thiotrichales bacterium]
MSNEKEAAVENGADDVQLEVDVNEVVDGEETPAQSQDKLLLELQDAQQKADEHWNQLLMARADLSNAQRRSERDLANAHKFAVEKLALELIPVKDSMEMGLAAVTEGDEQGEGQAKVIEGMALTLQMFSGVLDKSGVKEVNPQGEKFNPDFHQAMSMQETADFAPNMVMTVFQKGYVLNDRLIRPAMVVVSKAVAK